LLRNKNNNNNKLYLHDYNKELQHCKSRFKLKEQMLPKIKHFQNIVATAQKSIPLIFFC